MYKINKLFEIIQHDKKTPINPKKLYELNIKEIKKVRIIVMEIVGRISLKNFVILFSFQDKIGPIPITKIAGIIIGTTVEF